jgi:hypothetical protein
MGVQGAGSGHVEKEIPMRKLRRHPRVGLKTFHGEIAAENRVCRGRIIDASTTGLKIIDIDPDLFKKGSIYALTLSGKEHNHRVMVTPCWVRKDVSRNYGEAGLKLVSAPWEWISFVLDQAILQDAGIATTH